MKAEVKAKWELNETAFDKLLAALSEDREEAGGKYLLLIKNLLRYFEVRGIYNPQNAADEVINRLARKLEAGENFENISTYALGIARFVTLELRKVPEQIPSNKASEIAVYPISNETSEKDRKLLCLNECLSKLPAVKKNLIKNYYQGERREKIEKRKKMAEDLRIPQNALRSRAVRIRNKLESCIRKCLTIEN